LDISQNFDISAKAAWISAKVSIYQPTQLGYQPKFRYISQHNLAIRQSLTTTFIKKTTQPWVAYFKRKSIWIRRMRHAFCFTYCFIHFILIGFQYFFNAFCDSFSVIRITFCTVFNHNLLNFFSAVC